MSAADDVRPPVPLARAAALRWLLAACYGAMVAATWGVWRVRAEPPMLPLLPLPQAPVGAALLAAVALAAWRPRAGVAVHAAVLAYAVLADELRLQPYVVSLTLLLWGASELSGLATLARAHLVALWFWGGAHKALSPVFARGVAPVLLVAAWPGAPAWAQAVAGYAVITGEIGVAALALVPRTRRVAAASAVLLHAVAVVVVSRPALGRNVALWPWNAALAVAAVALVGGWREGAVASLRACAVPLRALCVAALLAPAIYYAGALGATFAHVLYTGSVASTVWCDARGRCRSDVEQREAIARLGVMVPPEPRVLRRYFRARCRPGERMVLHDPRRDHGAEPSLEEVACPRGGPGETAAQGGELPSRAGARTLPP